MVSTFAARPHTDPVVVVNAASGSRGLACFRLRPQLVGVAPEGLRSCWAKSCSKATLGLALAVGVLVRKVCGSGGSVRRFFAATHCGHGRVVAQAASSSDARDGPGPRVAFVIGGPGSGKGTQCEFIAREFGFQHLSAGELLRAERQREGSPLGGVIEDAIKSGGVVPSEVIAELLECAMREGGWSDAKFIVDGYPRSVEQLEGWTSVLSKRVRFLFCLSLEVSEEEMRRRLLGRAETSGRLDDNENTIAKRFVTFKMETGPLLEHFETQGLLQRVDGGRALEEVWTSVRTIFEAEEDSEAANIAGDEVSTGRADVH